MRVLLVSIALVSAAFIAAAQQAPAPAAAAPSTDTAASAPAESALVKTAREAKARRKASSRKVIRNADVKKSRGKVTVRPVAPLPAEVAKAAAPAKGELELQDERLRARREAAAHVGVLEKRVSELEKDLNRVEQSFYEENDPNVRDGVIHKRFLQTRKQLEDARRELADGRDALTAVDQKQ